MRKNLKEARQKAGMTQRQVLEDLKRKLEINRERIPEHELKTTYKKAYEKLQKKIARLESIIGER